MNIKRILTTAIVVLAAAAPAAQARPATDGPQVQPGPTAAQVASDHAQMAAAREAVTQRHYDMAREAPRVDAIATDEGGFPWTVALGIAFLPALVMGAGIVRPAVKRRRRQVQIAG